MGRRGSIKNRGPRRQLAMMDSRNRVLAAGILTLAADAMTMLSGAGLGTAVGDPFRIGAGAVGSGGTTLQVLIGMKRVSDRHDFLRSLTALRLVFLIKAAAAMSLIVSGLVVARYTESVLGFWIASAFLIKALVKEKADLLDPPAQAEHVPAVRGSRLDPKRVFRTLSRYLKEVRGRPIKLGSDMLNVTALLVVLEAIVAYDVFRFVCGLLLMASNVVFRDVKKSDFS